MGNYRLSVVPPYTTLFPDQGAIGLSLLVSSLSLHQLKQSQETASHTIHTLSPDSIYGAYRVYTGNPTVGLHLFVGR